MANKTRNPFNWFKKAEPVRNEEVTELSRSIISQRKQKNSKNKQERGQEIIDIQPPPNLKRVEIISEEKVEETFDEKESPLRRFVTLAILIPSILVTLGLISGGVWWFNQWQKSSNSSAPLADSQETTDKSVESTSSETDKNETNTPTAKAPENLTEKSAQSASSEIDKNETNTASAKAPEHPTEKSAQSASSEIDKNETNTPTAKAPEHPTEKSTESASSETDKNETNTATAKAPNNLSRVLSFPSGEFSYGGSTAWAPIRRDIDSVLQSSFPKFQLRYTTSERGISGSSEGIHMLINNQLAFAQSTRPVHAEEHQAALKQGFYLSEIKVGFEAIAIAVHPELEISGLTLAQLKEIYTGQITNWNQVGGPDLEIVPYSLSATNNGTAEFFEKHIMGNLPFGKNVKFISTTTLALRQLAKHRGGLYYASAPEIIGQCTVKPLPLGLQADQMVAPYTEPLVPANQCPERRNQTNLAAIQKGNYPLIQPLFVVVKHNGKASEKAGTTYARWLLTEEGQELLRKAGFIHIR